MSTPQPFAYGTHFEHERSPHLFTRISNWLKQRRDCRATMKALQDLSDHELKDLGINRGDVRRIAGQASADWNR